MNDKPASPVCYASEADDAYMGYAPRAELIAELNVLLEAERAGARVARAFRRAPRMVAFADLMRAVGADEARWCAMLTREVKQLGGTPSSVCGAFYGKAMAIRDPVERIAFLNRGQGWVARKLAALLPRVRDDALHAALAEMAENHTANIARAARAIEPETPRP
jgi:hypothetical protein